MRKIADNIIKLKKYFVLALSHKNIPKAELLSSNEALKDFGKLWIDHANDVMTMSAIIEYEYINKGTYTPEEIGAMKYTLAAMIKFLRGCSSEWQIYEKSQIRK